MYLRKLLFPVLLAVAAGCERAPTQPQVSAGRSPLLKSRLLYFQFIDTTGVRHCLDTRTDSIIDSVHLSSSAYVFNYYAWTSPAVGQSTSSRFFALDTAGSGASHPGIYHYPLSSAGSAWLLENGGGGEFVTVIRFDSVNAAGTRTFWTARNGPNPYFHFDQSSYAEDSTGSARFTVDTGCP